MRTEDGHIIQKCLDGDAAAFGLLVDKYKGSVYALAYAKLGNFHDAQDITQEVFLKAYKKLRTLKRWDRVLSWLYAITSNSCKDFFRSKASRPDSEYIADQEEDWADKISIDSHHDDEIHHTLREALSELPEIHRQVLTLHYLGGMSCREIAQFLGVSPHAIAMRLNRARSKLRKEMLTMMHTSFDGQKIHSAFTLRIVEAVQRTRVQPNPQAPAGPIGIALVSLLAISMLCLFTPFDQLPVIGKLAGTPIFSETKVPEVGEIPVDVVILSETSVVSSGDGKKDLGTNSRMTDEVHTAHADTETETDTQNRPIARLGNGSISKMVYSPDGELIAAAGTIGIWLYDAETLAEVGMIAHGASVIAFSPDGQTLASGHQEDEAVHLWDVSTQDQIRSLLWPGIVLSSDREQRVVSIAFAPDGQTVAVGRVNGDVDFWYVEDGLLINTLVCGESTKILAFSPDGRLLASGGSERIIKVWDVQSPGNLHPPPTAVRYFEEHDTQQRQLKVIVDDAVSSMAFSPDGKMLVSARAGKVPASLWDVATETKIAQLIDYGNEKGFPSIVAFSPDGAIIVTAGNEGRIRLWDAQTQRRIVVLETNAGGVSSMAFHPNGKTLASLSSRYIARNEYRAGDMMIRLWDVERRTQIDAAQHHHAAVTAVSLQPRGRLLASGHLDGVVVLWDMQNQEKIGVLRGLNAMVESVAFNPDGTLLASSERENVRLWDVQERKQIVGFKNDVAIAGSVAFSPDGKTLASVDNTVIRLWDTQRKRMVGELRQETRRMAPRQQPMTAGKYNAYSVIESVAFSPDGKLLASGGIDNTVRLWDVQKRKEIFIREPGQSEWGSIFAVAFSPDGKILVSAGSEGIHLWVVAEHKLIGTLIEEEYVKTLAFSPDGRFLAAGAGRKIRVWDMKSLAELTTFEGSAPQITSLAFGSDGKTLIAGSWDGVIRVWDTSRLGSD